MKKVAELDYYHFSTSNPGSFSLLNEACFDLWEAIWTDTFRELGVSGKQVLSDDFLSKELGGLFLDGKPVGFMLFHFCNVKKRSHQKMSYFNNYPEGLYQRIIAVGELSMVITYMTLAPEWRKASTDLPISELLMGFAVLRFLDSAAARLIGYFRNDRGTNDIFYRHGGLKLAEGERAYNVDVDFAQITRASAQLSSVTACAHMTLSKWFQFKNKNGEFTNENTRTTTENELTHPKLSDNALDGLDIL